MSRSALLDPGIDLTKLSGSGVLIGSYLPSHLLGVYVAPTPVEEGEDGEGKGELDVPWMLEHAKQVFKMLPGGVHVIGFVYNSTPDVFTKSESKIRKLLSGLRALDSEADEVVFLLPDLKGKSLQADNLKNVDFKVSETQIEFVELDTSVILDIPIAHSCDQKASKMLHTHAEKGVLKFERSLATSLCLFNSELKGPEETICPPQFEAKKKGKGKHKQMEAEEEEEEGSFKFSVHILVQDDPNVGEEVLIEDNNIRIKLAGKMTSRSYMPKGSSIAQCKVAVISDIKRSLRSRILMHCDSLVGDEGEEGEAGDGPIVHEPPRRVLTLLPGTSISISDYLYPGEGGEDALESIKEIFGFSPTEEDIEDDLEIVAAAKDVKRDADKSIAEGRSKKVGGMYLAVSLGVAALSAALAWFRFSRDSTEEADESI